MHRILGKHKELQESEGMETFFNGGGHTSLIVVGLKNCLPTIVVVKRLLYDNSSFDLATDTPLLNTTVNFILSSKK